MLNFFFPFEEYIYIYIYGTFEILVVSDVGSLT